MNATPANVASIVAASSSGADLSQMADRILAMKGGEEMLNKLIAAALQLQTELDSIERNRQVVEMMMLSN